MRIGFLIPTDLESENLPETVRHVTCAGYGAGKTAACSAAAELVFGKRCDTVIVWGLAGGLSPRVAVDDIVVGTRVAYRDYDIHPLLGSTGVGWVQDFAEDVFVELDADLRERLVTELRRMFPERRVVEGTVCTGDQFMQYAPGSILNRVERESDVVDMESAAVVHFCHNLHRKVRVGIVRVVSDHADHRANVDFVAFLKAFAAMNGQTDVLRRQLAGTDGTDIEPARAAIRDYPDFPVKGVLFKDIFGILADTALVDTVCHALYDRFRIRHPAVPITKVAGIESRGFILGFELARMFGVPFVPLRKKGKLPGKVVAAACKTEYSEVVLEAQEGAFTSADCVLVVDDIIATGGSMLAAREIARKCGGRCDHCLAIGQIKGLDGTSLLETKGMSADCLWEL